MHAGQPLRSRQSGFTLLELLVVIAIIAILIGLLLPAIQRVREGASRTQCDNNFKQIGLAMHGFHDQYGAFPPAFAKPSNWGWAVFILPFLEQNDLYNLLDPLGGTSLMVNAGTVRPIAVYVCPSDPARAPINHFFLDYGKSNYVVSEQICDGGSAYSMQTITDGTSNTLMVGERDMYNQVGGVWAGRDSHAGGVQTVIGRPNWPINTKYAGGFTCCSTDMACTRFAFSSLHPGGANFLFCDGSVRFLNEAIPTDLTQENCNHPVAANNLFFNLYFKDDGNIVGEDF